MTIVPGRAEECILDWVCHLVFPYGKGGQETLDYVPKCGAELAKWLCNGKSTFDATRVLYFAILDGDIEICPHDYLGSGIKMLCQMF